MPKFSIEFQNLLEVKKNIRLIPLYEVTDEPYTIYFEELNY